MNVPKMSRAINLYNAYRLTSFHSITVNNHNSNSFIEQFIYKLIPQFCYEDI